MKVVICFSSAVVNALKFLAAADGPVDGAGMDPHAEFVFQLVQQFKRVAGLAVHFVDKGKDRDMAHGADLEELPGLRLDAFAPSMTMTAESAAMSVR